MAKWIPILRRKGVPVLFYSYINHGYMSEYYQELLGAPHGCEYHQYVDGWVVINSEDSARFTDAFLPRLDEPTYVEFFLRQCAAVSEDLIAFGSQARNKDYASLDAADLLFDFMRFSSYSIRVMPFLNTMVFVQDAIERRLRKVLSRHFGIDEESAELAGRMQSLMLGGATAPLATQSITALSELANEVRENYGAFARQVREDPANITQSDIQAQSADLWKQFSRYLREYDFLGTDYYLGEPSTLRDLCEQLAVFLAKRSDQSDALHDSFARSNEESRLGERDRSLIETARTMQYLREYRLEALFKAGRDCRDLLSRIGEVVGVSYLELVYMTFDEIQRSLASSSLVVDLALVAERMEGFASYVEDGSPRFVVGAELEMLRRTLPGAPAPTDTLSGVTAYPGECTGAVRIIDHISKVHELSAGDILVTPMTLPYHVPAMARAGAVLTDEGGILSHAAIVSRELRIPCIVGLGSATSAFSNGDQVWVRATATGGVVERVSRE